MWVEAKRMVTRDGEVWVKEVWQGEKQTFDPYYNPGETQWRKEVTDPENGVMIYRFE